MTSNPAWRSLCILVAAAICWLGCYTETPEQVALRPAVDQWHGMLRDPATGEIPPGIRRREVEFVSSLPRSAPIPGFEWQEMGPHGVGGRTRALQVDRDDSSAALAGGVNGGMWKTTDHGATWRKVSPPMQGLSATALAQDPRPGQRHVWYYATGEKFGTNHDGGRTSFIQGTGIYKSSDRGESWTLLEASSAGDPTAADTGFEFISRLAASPLTGTLLAAADGSGIVRSEDGGQSFQMVLGQGQQNGYADVDIAPDGRMLASLAGPDRETATLVWLSQDDGINWTTLLDLTWGRTLVKFAPSRPDTVYIFDEDERFFRYDLSDGSLQDRTQVVRGVSLLFTITGYTMVLAVHPLDAELVIVGGINLFRSRNGFADASAIDRIAGFVGRTTAFIPGNHPDPHVVAFDPSQPDAAWSGHDGGISYTADIRAETVQWQRLNNGYNVTQFYDVSLDPRPGRFNLLGGTQDNGSLWFRQIGGLTSPASDFLFIFGTGDGGVSELRPEVAYTASLGRIVRIELDELGRPRPETGIAVQPRRSASPVLYQPFLLDPHDSNRIYYSKYLNGIWRNSIVDQLAAERLLEEEPSDPFQGGESDLGWEKLEVDGADVTAMAISTHPPDILYYGFLNESGQPRLKRLDNAAAALSGEIDVSIPQAPQNAYLHSIAVNPQNGNEILAAYSNYNIVGLFHSSDGGESYQAVEGNLQGSDQLAGPSLRSLAILPGPVGMEYFVGTSAGLFATGQLEGQETVWELQAPDLIGLALVVAIDGRPADGALAVATHGRGIFIRKPAAEADDEVVSGLDSLVFPVFASPSEGFTGYSTSNESPQSAVQVFQAWGREGELTLRPQQVQLETAQQQTLLAHQLLKIEPPLQVTGWLEAASDSDPAGTLFLQGSGTSLDGSSAARQQSKQLYFTRLLSGPSAFRGQSGETRIEVINPNRHAIQVRLIEINGEDLLLAEQAIPAKGFWRQKLSELSEGFAPGAFLAAEVVQGQGAVGFSVTEFPQASTLIALPASLPLPPSNLYSPQMAIGGGLFSHLQLANPNQLPAQLRLKAVNDDGGIAAQADLNLAPRSAASIDLGEALSLPDGFVGSLVAESQSALAGDVIIGSSQGLAFAAGLSLQRSGYRRAVLNQMADASNVFTGLALFNTSLEAAQVTVRVLDNDGSLVGESLLQLPAGGRLSKQVVELVESASDRTSGRLEILSDQPLVAQQIFGLLDQGVITAFAVVPPTVLPEP